MKKHARTLTLLFVAISIFAWRVAGSNKHRTQAGIPVLLTHPCSWQEALRQLGDDRQIVVTYNGGQAKINQSTFRAKEIEPQLQKIFMYRNWRAFWFIGDPKRTYGDTLRALSSTAAIKLRTDVILPTESQLYKGGIYKPIAADGTIPLQDCPYADSGQYPAAQSIPR